MSVIPNHPEHTPLADPSDAQGSSIANPAALSVLVNGRAVAFAGGVLMDLLRQLSLDQRSGMAVALNDQVVPKSQWAEQMLQPQDRITLITATAGG